jgi:OmpA-OmpF porin, OOP family
MRRLLAATLALALSVPTTTVVAQQIGTVDAGFFGRFTLVDKSLSPNDEMKNALSLGGRFGIFMLNNLALELEHAAGGTLGDDRVGFAPFYLRLAYHKALNDKWSGIIGAGWVRDRTNPFGPGGLFSDDGYTGLLGAQRAINDRMSLRFDVIADYLPSPIFEGPGNDLTNVNIHFQAGLNWRWAAKPPMKDADNDGVADENDRCPNTPAGAYVNYFGCEPEKDADNDGVLDSADRCPNTPAGVAVNAEGCPLDSDGDGVADHLDRCPNTPAGVAVNAQGCPLDSDGDGVPDNLDRCPNTPAGVAVNAQGCPLDSDGDGVPDAQDACPNTPAGMRVDARGCQLLFEEGRTNVVLEGVTFATGSANLTEESKVILDRVAESLVAATEVNIEVQGHTDNTGSLAVNNRLSEARAMSVRAYLIEKGVAAQRITARGYGPSQPAVPNTTAEGRQQNRRVELKRTN